MAESFPVALSDDGFVILSQIYCAFAQGADGLSIDGGAFLAARDDYRGPIEREKDKWELHAPQVLSLSRTMGRVAAHIALTEGRITIQASHYRSARNIIHEAAFCPFFHGKH
jgi:hypothetical protein